MGGRVGLDYPGVMTVLRVKRIPNREQVFGDIQAMEVAALDVWHTK